MEKLLASVESYDPLVSAAKTLSGFAAVFIRLRLLTGDFIGDHSLERHYDQGKLESVGMG